MKIEYSDIQPGALLKREQGYNILFLVLAAGENHVVGLVPVHCLDSTHETNFDTFINAYPMGRRLDIWRGYIQYPAWSLYAPAS